MHGRVQQYDGLTYTSSPVDGTPQTFKGIDAFVRAQADSAAHAAMALVMVNAIEELFPGAENAKGRNDLYERAKFASQKTAFDIGAKIRGRITTEHQTQATQAVQPQQDARWMQNYTTAIQKALPALTADDIQAGQAFFAKRPQLVYRTATPQDAQKYGVKVGERFGDTDALNDWYAERAAGRAAATEKSLALVTATGTANKHNAGMEKGRQAGKKPASARRPQAATPATVSPERVGKKQVYTDILDEALQEMGISD